MMRIYVAYKGECFQIEWYWDANEHSQPLEYFEALDDDQKVKALVLFKRMGDTGKIFDTTKFRNEGDKVFAFKPMPDRFLSFFTIGKRIIITNAFVKKSDKLPREEKDRALKHMKDYKRRTEHGTYYED